MSFSSKVRHLVVLFHIARKSSWIAPKKKSNQAFFLRSEESKEQCAAEVMSADAEEELSSDSCSNTEDIQPEGGATPAETHSWWFQVNFSRN